MAWVLIFKSRIDQEMTGIFRTLETLGVATEENRLIFSEGTRDRDDVTVFKDSVSGVIYIDNFYSGDEAYQEGDYRDLNLAEMGARDLEIRTDAKRRLKAYMPFVCGRDILDFGCGDGAFLRMAQQGSTSCTGVELQRSYIENLNEEGIPCFPSLDNLGSEAVQTVFSFHVLEHLPNPLETLAQFKRVLKPEGTLIIEVPHANDILLNELDCRAFKAFTLWSQHLVLHTRDSLKRLLNMAGFENVTIEGVQRYPLSNHLHWLSKAKPGGHKTRLSLLDTPELRANYEASLNRIDATDTLVAVADV